MKKAAAILSLLFLFGLFSCSAAAAEKVRITLDSGQETVGKVDARSNSARLWLRSRSGGTVQLRSFSRDKIRKIVLVGNPAESTPSVSAAVRAQKLLSDQ